MFAKHFESTHQGPKFDSSKKYREQVGSLRLSEEDADDSLSMSVCRRCQR
jgi:hypothetical protein